MIKVIVCLLAMITGITAHFENLEKTNVSITLNLTMEEKQRFVDIHNLFRRSFDLPLNISTSTMADERACEDSHEECPWRAMMGQCTQYPEWMLTNCRMSCLMCRSNFTCEDTEPFWCNKWLERDECRDNPNWMRPYCNVSCETCPRQAMPDIRWSDRLAEEAANQTRDCNFTHTWHSPYGENLFLIGRAHWNATEAANAACFGWAEEREFEEDQKFLCAYGYGKGSCGHYTQMIWYDTTEVGCAVHHCGDPDNEWKSTFVTCMYNPPGNWVIYYYRSQRFVFKMPVIYGLDMINDRIDWNKLERIPDY